MSLIVLITFPLLLFANILIFSFSIFRTCLGRATRTCPQILARPIPWSQLVICCATLVSCTERLACSSRVVVTIALSTEVYQLLFAVGTRLNHLLLACPVGFSNPIALHLALSRHILSCICYAYVLLLIVSLDGSPYFSGFPFIFATIFYINVYSTNICTL
jgi:hypothetical protein